MSEQPNDPPAVSVNKISPETIEYLRPHALKAGFSDRKGAILRWAILDKERVLRELDRIDSLVTKTFEGEPI